MARLRVARTSASASHIATEAVPLAIASFRLNAYNFLHARGEPVRARQRELQSELRVGVYTAKIDLDAPKSVATPNDCWSHSGKDLLGSPLQHITNLHKAELSAAATIESCGFTDAVSTTGGADGGIDVRSSRALAQVK